MRTAVEAVDEVLAHDATLHDALHREVLNIRRAARWMIEAYRWPFTEEAVVSALRRHHPQTQVDPKQVRALFRSAQVSARTGLTLLVVNSGGDGSQAIARALAGGSLGQETAVLPLPRATGLVLNEAAAEAAIERMRPSAPDAIYDRAARIDVAFPDGAGVAATALASIVTNLGHAGVNTLAVCQALSHACILVPGPDAPVAYTTVLSLVAREA